ncbi:hypothetical protein DAMA08_026560 [Martiniozyma asiatica (nom. inval.)]|nr:hypothetical protein DAMA08_026560 [Martiniozyma asiatica]
MRNNLFKSSERVVGHHYQFSKGKWNKSETALEFNDCSNDDEDAVIQLSHYTYLPAEEIPDAAMSMSDMKSAVGGGEVGNSLFSSSAAHAAKEKEAKTENDSTA